MRIFSKKSFKFDDPNGQEPSVTVGSMEFKDVPDWVESSTMFKLASQDGDVSITSSKGEEAAAQASDPELDALRAQAKELGVKGFANMKRDTLEAKISEAQASAEAARVAQEEADRLAAEEAAKKAAGGA